MYKDKVWIYSDVGKAEFPTGMLKQEGLKYWFPQPTEQVTREVVVSGQDNNPEKEILMWSSLGFLGYKFACY